MAKSGLQGIVEDLRKIEARIDVEMERHAPGFDDAPRDLWRNYQALYEAKTAVGSAANRVGAVADIEDRGAASKRCDCRC